MAVAKRRGARKARVALARKLGVILHRMWVVAAPKLTTDRSKVPAAGHNRGDSTPWPITEAGIRSSGFSPVQFRH